MHGKTCKDWCIDRKGPKSASDIPEYNRVITLFNKDHPARPPLPLIPVKREKAETSSSKDAPTRVSKKPKTAAVGLSKVCVLSLNAFLLFVHIVWH